MLQECIDKPSHYVMQHVNNIYETDDYVNGEPHWSFDRTGNVASFRFIIDDSISESVLQDTLVIDMYDKEDEYVETRIKINLNIELN